MEKAGDRLTRNLYQRATSVHARVLLSLIILQIYPCNNGKYINTKGDDIRTQ
jgi:hypothetical protein